jgi:hypothetical protein
MLIYTFFQIIKLHVGKNFQKQENRISRTVLRKEKALGYPTISSFQTRYKSHMVVTCKCQSQQAVRVN